MPKKVNKNRFAICVANEGCDDLELRKVYRVLPDASAERSKFLRIVDESGEDYLYPANLFVLVGFPPAVEEKLLSLPLSPSA